jgi:hypothetical protein
MRYFYDTEFLEDGVTIELISIGIVAEDGREYYAVSSEMPWERIVQHEWLMQNVVPSLPLKQGWDVPLLDFDDPSVKSRLDIRRDIVSFFIAGDAPVELWAWYGAYDHICLAQLFGQMVNMPRLVPHWTNDLRQETERLGVYQQLPVQDSGEHNALEDARWNKAVGDFLTSRNWERDSVLREQ